MSLKEREEDLETVRVGTHIQSVSRLLFKVGPGLSMLLTWFLVFFSAEGAKIGEHRQ